MITRQQSPRTSLPYWAWPTALSLDAPLVAISWQWLFSWRFEHQLHWQHSLILGLTVWLIYVADRWLDGLKLDLTKSHTFRHALYVRHRRAFLVLWCLGLIVNTTLVLNILTKAELQFGIALSTVTLLYAIGVHLLKPLSRASKELQVGLVFALGSSLLVWSQAASFNLFFATLMFAFLCTFNCLLIALWERSVDTAQKQASMLGVFPKLAILLPVLLLGFSGLSVICWWLSHDWFYLAICLSTLLLYLLQIWRQQVNRELLRVLADAALLSPLLFLVLGKV